MLIVNAFITLLLHSFRELAIVTLPQVIVPYLVRQPETVIVFGDGELVLPDLYFIVDVAGVYDTLPLSELGEQAAGRLGAGHHLDVRRYLKLMLETLFQLLLHPAHAALPAPSFLGLLLIWLLNDVLGL